MAQDIPVDARDGRSRLFLWALLAVLLAFCFRLAEPFLWPIISAAMLAIALYPLHGWVSRFVRRPGLAALLSTLLTMLVVVVPLVFVGTAITSEATDLYHSLSQRSEQSGGWSAFLLHLIERPARWVESRIPIAIPDLSTQVVARLQQAAAFLLAKGGAIVGGLTALIGSTLLCFVILFFFFRDGSAILSFLQGLLPLSLENSQRFFDTIYAAITANLYGVVAVASLQGSALGAGFWILGLPSPVMWGLVAVFCSMIPIVGSSLIWIPAAIVLFLQGMTWKGVAMLGWGVLIIGMIDNILRPLIVGRGANLHTLLVLFSILGGTAAFGLIGLVLGPVIVSVTAVTIRTLRELHGHQTSEETAQR